jgi:hypothetical protein
MSLRTAMTLLCLLVWPTAGLHAGIEESLDDQLNILAQGRVPERLIPGAEYRVAVVTYEDPDGTGLGDTIASLVAREVLTNSRVGSIGVIFFKEGVSPSAGSNLAYFDKVEKVTAAQGVKLAIWGIVRAVDKGVEIHTFAQVPGPALEQHFTWRLRLPAAMGGKELMGRLRPDRILVQRLRVGESELDQIRSAAEAITQVRAAPRSGAAVTASLPMKEVYYIAAREGDWVRLATRSGIDGWAPTRGHCLGSCGQLLQSATYAGGLLRYMSDGKVPGASGSLTEESRAVSDQLGALGLLGAGTMRDLSRIERISRPWLKDEQVPPGGAAFANIGMLGYLSMELKAELSREVHGVLDEAKLARLYDQVELDKRTVRSLAFKLAEASLADPRNTDVLHNLSVLFRYAGDSERAELAGSLAAQAGFN